MIAIDSSSWIAYLSGEHGEDVEATELALSQKQATLPPVVLSELLSDPHLPASVAALLLELPSLTILEGYWERTGKLRSRLIGKGHKARLADTLIAQICIDHQASLITRDSDFKNLARFSNLKLLL